MLQVSPPAHNLTGPAAAGLDRPEAEPLRTEDKRVLRILHNRPSKGKSDGKRMREAAAEVCKSAEVVR